MYTGVEVSRAEASHYVESRGVGVQSVLEQQTLLMKLARCSLRRDVLRMRERDVHDRYSVPTRPPVSRQTRSISRLITISFARQRLIAKQQLFSCIQTAWFGAEESKVNDWWRSQHGKITQARLCSLCSRSD